MRTTINMINFQDLSLQFGIAQQSISNQQLYVYYYCILFLNNLVCFY